MPRARRCLTFVFLAVIGAGLVSARTARTARTAVTTQVDQAGFATSQPSDLDTPDLVLPPAPPGVADHRAIAIVDREASLRTSTRSVDLVALAPKTSPPVAA